MLKPGIHAFALLLGSTALAAAIELGMPAQCTLGEDCFVQQFPDLDPGANAVDSDCGSATYDGHDGLDLRVLSLVDVARGVPVLAMADGTVVGVRDESPDKMIEGQAQAQAVSREGCGNLALIDHGDGYQTRYCHMRHGTVSVRKGDSVKRGQQIGLIGASGMAEFPHVEIAVSKDGKTLDPVTDAPSTQAACATSPRQSLCSRAMWSRRSEPAKRRCSPSGFPAMLSTIASCRNSAHRQWRGRIRQTASAGAGSSICARATVSRCA